MDAMKIDGRLLTRQTSEAVYVDAYVLVIDGQIESIDPAQNATGECE